MKSVFQFYVDEGDLVLYHVTGSFKLPILYFPIPRNLLCQPPNYAETTVVNFLWEICRPSKTIYGNSLLTFCGVS